MQNCILQEQWETRTQLKVYASGLKHISLRQVLQQSFVICSIQLILIPMLNAYDPVTLHQSFSLEIPQELIHNHYIFPLSLIQLLQLVTIVVSIMALSATVSFLVSHLLQSSTLSFVFLSFHSLRKQIKKIKVSAYYKIHLQLETFFL